VKPKYGRKFLAMGLTIFLGIFENHNLLSSFYTRKKNVFDGLQGGQKTMNVLQPMNICVVYTENILLK
jgi:hypothetical protein